jgi:peptidoglycan glycosyltransferase
MNDQIVKLFGVIAVLFALLVFFTSRWSVIDASALNANPLNSRATIASERIKRGEILAADGSVLAKSKPAGGGTWSRTYPQGALFAQPVGFNRGSGNDSGLEESYSKQLEGTRTGFSSVFGPLTSDKQIGDDVHTSLDPKAQALARTELDGRVGSVVALDPSTGSILAMYSNPTYDDNNPDHLPADQTQFNRATQSMYPPGSTFKIVTAAAAIDTGKYTPDSQVDGSEPAIISGVPLNNDPGDPPLHNISLTYALTQSINTAWARVGVSLGTKTMTEYMKRFGFYATPPIDLPPGSLRASDVLSPAGSAYPVGSADEDIGRIAIGQGGLAVTPLQMVMVASAVADGGKLMVPHFATRIVNHDGQVQTVKPQLYHQVMSPQTAADVNQMMRTVVDEGTGTPAQLGGGITFAGKTGTASVGPAGAGETQPWFIGFAPAQDPKVAIAVDLEKTAGEYGGQVAAPIARDVVQQLLSDGK